MKRLKSNSAVVLSAMLKKKMTARQAAKALCNTRSRRQIHFAENGRQAP